MDSLYDYLTFILPEQFVQGTIALGDAEKSISGLLSQAVEDFNGDPSNSNLQIRVDRPCGHLFRRGEAVYRCRYC